MGTMLESVRERILEQRVRPPMAELIGLHATRLDEGVAEVELEADARHHNPMGTVHGGILCDLADWAMGMAYASTLEADESFTTLELKVNFLRPVRQGFLRATGVVVSSGRSVGLVECDIVDAQDRLIAHATSTCMTLRGAQAEGRRPGEAQGMSVAGAAPGDLRSA